MRFLVRVKFGFISLPFIANLLTRGICEASHAAESAAESAQKAEFISSKLRRLSANVENGVRVVHGEFYPLSVNGTPLPFTVTTKALNESTIEYNAIDLPAPLQFDLSSEKDDDALMIRGSQVVGVDTESNYRVVVKTSAPLSSSPNRALEDFFCKVNAVDFTPDGRVVLKDESNQVILEEMPIPHTAWTVDMSILGIEGLASSETSGADAEKAVLRTVLLEGKSAFPLSPGLYAGEFILPNSGNSRNLFLFELDQTEGRVTNVKLPGGPEAYNIPGVGSLSTILDDGVYLNYNPLYKSATVRFGGGDVITLDRRIVSDLPSVENFFRCSDVLCDRRGSLDSKTGFGVFSDLLRQVDRPNIASLFRELDMQNVEGPILLPSVSTGAVLVPTRASPPIITGQLPNPLVLGGGLGPKGLATAPVNPTLDPWAVSISAVAPAQQYDLGSKINAVEVALPAQGVIDSNIDHIGRLPPIHAADATLPPIQREGLAGFAVQRPSAAVGPVLHAYKLSKDPKSFIFKGQPYDCNKGQCEKVVVYTIPIQDRSVKVLISGSRSAASVAPSVSCVVTQPIVTAGWGGAGSATSDGPVQLHNQPVADAVQALRDILCNPHTFEQNLRRGKLIAITKAGDRAEFDVADSVGGKNTIHSRRLQALYENYGTESILYEALDNDNFGNAERIRLELKLTEPGKLHLLFQFGVRELPLPFEIFYSEGDGSVVGIQCSLADLRLYVRNDLLKVAPRLVELTGENFFGKTDCRRWRDRLTELFADPARGSWAVEWLRAEGTVYDQIFVLVHTSTVIVFSEDNSVTIKALHGDLSFAAVVDSAVSIQRPEKAEVLVPGQKPNLLLESPLLFYSPDATASLNDLPKSIHRIPPHLMQPFVRPISVRPHAPLRAIFAVAAASFQSLPLHFSIPNSAWVDPAFAGPHNLPAPGMEFSPNTRRMSAEFIVPRMDYDNLTYMRRLGQSDASSLGSRSDAHVHGNGPLSESHSQFGHRNEWNKRLDFEPRPMNPLDSGFAGPPTASLDPGFAGPPTASLDPGFAGPPTASLDPGFAGPPTASLDPGFAGPPTASLDPGFAGPPTASLDPGFAGPPTASLDPGFAGPPTASLDPGFAGPRPLPHKDYYVGTAPQQVAATIEGESSGDQNPAGIDHRIIPTAMSVQLHGYNKGIFEVQGPTTIFRFEISLERGHYVISMYEPPRQRTTSRMLNEISMKHEREVLHVVLTAREIRFVERQIIVFVGENGVISAFMSAQPVFKPEVTLPRNQAGLEDTGDLIAGLNLPSPPPPSRWNPWPTMSIPMVPPALTGMSTLAPYGHNNERPVLPILPAVPILPQLEPTRPVIRVNPFPESRMRESGEPYDSTAVDSSIAVGMAASPNENQQLEGLSLTRIVGFETALPVDEECQLDLAPKAHNSILVEIACGAASGTFEIVYDKETGVIAQNKPSDFNLPYADMGPTFRQMRNIIGNAAEMSITDQIVTFKADGGRSLVEFSLGNSALTARRLLTEEDETHHNPAEFSVSSILSSVINTFGSKSGLENLLGIDGGSGIIGNLLGTQQGIKLLKSAITTDGALSGLINVLTATDGPKLVSTLINLPGGLDLLTILVQNPALLNGVADLLNVPGLPNMVETLLRNPSSIPSLLHLLTAPEGLRLVIKLLINPGGIELITTLIHVPNVVNLLADLLERPGIGDLLQAVIETEGALPALVNFLDAPHAIPLLLELLLAPGGVELVIDLVRLPASLDLIALLLKTPFISGLLDDVIQTPGSVYSLVQILRNPGVLNLLVQTISTQEGLDLLLRMLSTPGTINLVVTLLTTEGGVAFLGQVLTSTGGPTTLVTLLSASGGPEFLLKVIGTPTGPAVVLNLLQTRAGTEVLLRVIATQGGPSVLLTLLSTPGGADLIMKVVTAPEGPAILITLLSSDIGTRFLLQLLNTQGGPSLLVSILHTSGGGEFLVRLLSTPRGPTVLLTVLGSQGGADYLLKYLATQGGPSVLLTLLNTTGGADLVLKVLGSPSGPSLLLSLVSTDHGSHYLLRVLGTVGGPTAVLSLLNAPGGADLLSQVLQTPAGPSIVVNLLETNEGTSLLLQIVSSPKGPSLLMTLLKSATGSELIIKILSSRAGPTLLLTLISVPGAADIVIQLARIQYGLQILLQFVSAGLKDADPNINGGNSNGIVLLTKLTSTTQGISILQNLIRSGASGVALLLKLSSVELGVATLNQLANQQKGLDLLSLLTRGSEGMQLLNQLVLLPPYVSSDRASYDEVTPSVPGIGGEQLFVETMSLGYSTSAGLWPTQQSSVGENIALSNVPSQPAPLPYAYSLPEMHMAYARRLQSVVSQDMDSALDLALNGEVSIGLRILYRLVITNEGISALLNLAESQQGLGVLLQLTRTRTGLDILWPLAAHKAGLQLLYELSSSERGIQILYQLIHKNLGLDVLYRLVHAQEGLDLLFKLVRFPSGVGLLLRLTSADEGVLLLHTLLVKPGGFEMLWKFVMGPSSSTTSLMGDSQPLYDEDSTLRGIFTLKNFVARRGGLSLLFKLVRPEIGVDALNNILNFVEGYELLYTLSATQEGADLLTHLLNRSGGLNILYILSETDIGVSVLFNLVTRTAGFDALYTLVSEQVGVDLLLEILKHSDGPAMLYDLVNSREGCAVLNLLVKADGGVSTLFQLAMQPNGVLTLQILLQQSHALDLLNLLGRLPGGIKLLNLLVSSPERVHLLRLLVTAPNGCEVLITVLSSPGGIQLLIQLLEVPEAVRLLLNLLSLQNGYDALVRLLTTPVTFKFLREFMENTDSIKILTQILMPAQYSSDPSVPPTPCPYGLETPDAARILASTLADPRIIDFLVHLLSTGYDSASSLLNKVLAVASTQSCQLPSITLPVTPLADTLFVNNAKIPLFASDPFRIVLYVTLNLSDLPHAIIAMEAFSQAVFEVDIDLMQLKVLEVRPLSMVAGSCSTDQRQTETLVMTLVTTLDKAELLKNANIELFANNGNTRVQVRPFDS